MTRTLVIHLALAALFAAAAFLIHWQGTRRRGAGLLLALLCLFVIPYLWCRSQPVEFSSDFNRAYYPAGYFILKDPSRLYQVDFSNSGFVNGPIVALLFTPLSHLSPASAQSVFLAAGLLAIAAACLLLMCAMKITGWRRACLLGLFVLNGPLYYSVREGNLTHVVLLLLAAAFVCIDRGRDLVLGCLLAAAAIIKPPLALLLGYYAGKRRWRVLGGASALLSLLAVLSLLVAGIEPHVAWWQNCIRAGASKPVAAYNVQSVSGFLARLFDPGATANWNGLDLGGNFKLLHYLILAALAGTTAGILWRGRRDTTADGERIELSAVLVLALLASPISWTHYYLLLLVPLALWLGGRLDVPSSWRWNVLMIAALLLMAPPVIGTDSSRLKERLLVSHCFFGGLLLLAVLLAARRRRIERSRTPLENSEDSTHLSSAPKRVA